jgi:RHS repeat-associated protein
MKKLAFILVILAFAVSAFAARAGIAGERMQKTGNTYEINYYITDHLGSTRVVVSSGGTVVGTNDYYPFGKLWESAGTQAPTTRYLFSGKEKQITGGINYMDFGSRMYDDFLGRWFTHDPQSYKRPWESPYGYCGGNPVSRIDENGELWWLSSLISGAISWVSNGLTTGHWGIKSFLIGAAAGVVGAGVGAAATSLATSWGVSSGLAGVIGSTVGGAASGAFNATLTGGNIGQGALFGGIGGLAGGATGLATKDMKFWGRLGLSTLSGGVVSGVFAEAQGGNFWNGFAAGAAGAAAGFLGNELDKYIEKTRRSQKFVKDLMKIDEKYLKKYGLGKIRTSPNIFDQDYELWNEIKSVFERYDIPLDGLRTRDYDSEAIIKLGKMHIRYGSDQMTHPENYKGRKHAAYNLNDCSINIHYDRFDVVLNPVLHFLFDTVYQGILGAH